MPAMAMAWKTRESWHRIDAAAIFSPRLSSSLASLISSQFSSRWYLPIEIPTTVELIAPATPTRQESWPLEMNDGAIADAAGMGDPEPAPLKLFVVLPLFALILLPC